MTTDLFTECHRTARDDGLAPGLSLLSAKLLPGALPCGQTGTAVLPPDLGSTADRVCVPVRTALSHGLTVGSWNFGGGVDRSVIRVVHGAEVEGEKGWTFEEPTHPNQHQAGRQATESGPLATEVGQPSDQAGRPVSDVGQSAAEMDRLATEPGRSDHGVGQLAPRAGRSATRTGRVATEASHLATDVSHLATDVSLLATDVSLLATEPSRVGTESIRLATEVGRLATEVGQSVTEVGRLTRLDSFDLPGGRVDLLRWSTCGTPHQTTRDTPHQVTRDIPHQVTGTPVVSGEVDDDVWAAWTLGLVWVRLGLSEALRDSCVQYLRGRRSGDSTLLQQQLVKGALADALAEQLEIRAVLAATRPDDVTPLLVNGLNAQVTRTDRALLRLLGATSMLLGGPGEVAHVSELVADAYLLDGDR